MNDAQRGEMARLLAVPAILKPSWEGDPARNPGFTSQQIFECDLWHMRPFVSEAAELVVAAMVSEGERMLVMANQMLAERSIVPSEWGELADIVAAVALDRLYEAVQANWFWRVYS